MFDKYYMNLKELDSFRLSDAVTFHDELNPKLWNNNNLRPEVKLQLKLIARDFLEELGIQGIDVEDLTVSGSNAAYSYTPHSDLDLHILVDMSKMPNDEIYKELFNAKKSLYNDSHDIKIHGVPVELYVQDAREPVVSLGEYSILNDKWLRIPTKRRANFDQTATKSKYEKLLNLIEIALKTRKYSKVQNIIKTIRRYRQAGLDNGGEFGPENLAYKALRSQGYITKLYDLKDKLHSEKLTIENMYQPITDEDYDPTYNVREAVDDNYLYHATQPSGMMRILRSGSIKASYRPQEATKARTQSPTVSTTRSKQYAESDDFVNFLNLTKEGNSVIIVFDRNAVANHYKMFSTSQGTQTVGDEFEEVIVAPKGMMPIQGTMKGFYFNPKRTSEIEEFKDTPWFKELVNSPYYMRTKQGMAEDETMQFAAEKTPATNPYGGLKDIQYRGSMSEASGYIPSEKEKNNPLFSSALTVDVHPDSIKKNAKAFGWLTSRAGIPPTLNTSGRF